MEEAAAAVEEAGAEQAAAMVEAAAGQAGPVEATAAVVETEALVEVQVVGRAEPGQATAMGATVVQAAEEVEAAAEQATAVAGGWQCYWQRHSCRSRWRCNLQELLAPGGTGRRKRGGETGTKEAGGAQQYINGGCN